MVSTTILAQHMQDSKRRLTAAASAAWERSPLSLASLRSRRCRLVPLVVLSVILVSRPLSGGGAVLEPQQCASNARPIDPSVTIPTHAPWHHPSRPAATSAVGIGRPVIPAPRSDVQERALPSGAAMFCALKCQRAFKTTKNKYTNHNNIITKPPKPTGSTPADESGTG